MENRSFEKLSRLLASEEEFTEKLKNTRAAKQLNSARTKLLEHVREVGRSGDLSLIVATEKAIVEGDLMRYANSQPMADSLKTAINELVTIERHIGIVDDPGEYRRIDQANSFQKNRLPKNRPGGLPNDEARQAFVSHYTRLNNLSKSRLGDDEKKVIDARKSAIFTAGKLYTERQAKTLGVDLGRGKKRGSSL